MRQNDLMKLAVALLCAVMIASFVGLPWKNELREIGTTDVAEIFFNNFGFALIILGLLLAAAMIGGVYLAKMEELP